MAWGAPGVLEHALLQSYRDGVLLAELVCDGLDGQAKVRTVEGELLTNLPLATVDLVECGH